MSSFNYEKYYMDLFNHPMENIEGVLRFRKSSLMRWLCDHIDMNEMWVAYRQGRFSQEEFMKFYRDIGYSISGFDDVWGDELDKG